MRDEKIIVEKIERAIPKWKAESAESKILILETEALIESGRSFPKQDDSLKRRGGDKID